MGIVHQIETMRAASSTYADRCLEVFGAAGQDIGLGAGCLLKGIIASQFMQFQIEMLKAAEAEEIAAQSFVDDLMAEKAPVMDPMEAAAIDAGYIKDERDWEPKGGANVKVTRHYFYPQDIGEANEGDIWHDLDGRPHFILGDGWIEARGFMPNCAEGQRIECETAEGKFSKSTLPIKVGQWLRSISPSSNQIAKFKLT